MVRRRWSGTIHDERGETASIGAEAELTWVPAPDDLDASVGHLDASRIDRSTSSPLAVMPPGLVEGNILPFRAASGRVIRHSVHRARRPSLEITPRVDASYPGPTTYFDATNTPEIAQLDDVLHRANASVVISPGRRVTMAA